MYSLSFIMFSITSLSGEYSVNLCVSLKLQYSNSTISTQRFQARLMSARKAKNPLFTIPLHGKGLTC